LLFSEPGREAPPGALGGELEGLTPTHRGQPCVLGTAVAVAEGPHHHGQASISTNRAVQHPPAHHYPRQCQLLCAQQRQE
jgi:hypothetical protein